MWGLKRFRGEVASRIGVKNGGNKQEGGDERYTIYIKGEVGKGTKEETNSQRDHLTITFAEVAVISL